MRPGTITERARLRQGRAGLSPSLARSPPHPRGIVPQQRGSAAGRDASPTAGCRALWGRTQGRTLTPGFLLGQCPTGGQLEQPEAGGSDQPPHHGPVLSAGPAWPLKPPAWSSGVGAAWAGGKVLGPEGGMGSGWDGVTPAVLCPEMPAGFVCRPHPCFHTPPPRSVSSRWPSRSWSCPLILGCLAPRWLHAGSVRARHWHAVGARAVAGCSPLPRPARGSRGGVAPAPRG